jgi:hypothetical protein
MPPKTIDEYVTAGPFIKLTPDEAPIPFVCSGHVVIENGINIFDIVAVPLW